MTSIMIHAIHKDIEEKKRPRLANVRLIKTLAVKGRRFKAEKQRERERSHSLTSSRPRLSFSGIFGSVVPQIMVLNMLSMGVRRLRQARYTFLVVYVQPLHLAVRPIRTTNVHVR